MKKSVWVIEQGCYSDYRVVGVFSSREKAQLVMDRCKRDYDKPTIAEWPLDPCVEELNQGYTLWLGEMLRDGTVERIVPWDFDTYYVNGDERLKIWRRSEAPAYKGKGVQDCLHGTVLAKDQEHAVKIFNEQRTQLIAANKW